MARKTSTAWITTAWSVMGIKTSMCSSYAVLFLLTSEEIILLNWLLYSIRTMQYGTLSSSLPYTDLKAQINIDHFERDFLNSKEDEF